MNQQTMQEGKIEAVTYELLAFGIARDIVGGSTISLSLDGSQTVGHLKEVLRERYPDFARLKSLAIAVEAAYREDDHVLNPSDEIVIIPPVSGG